MKYLLVWGLSLAIVGSNSYGADFGNSGAEEDFFKALENLKSIQKDDRVAVIYSQAFEHYNPDPDKEYIKLDDKSVKCHRGFRGESQISSPGEVPLFEGEIYHEKKRDIKVLCLGQKLYSHLNYYYEKVLDLEINGKTPETPPRLRDLTYPVGTKTIVKLRPAHVYIDFAVRRPLINVICLQGRPMPRRNGLSTPTFYGDRAETAGYRVMFTGEERVFRSRYAGPNYKRRKINVSCHF